MASSRPERLSEDTKIPKFNVKQKEQIREIVNVTSRSAETLVKLVKEFLTLKNISYLAVTAVNEPIGVEIHLKGAAYTFRRKTILETV